MRSNTTLGQVCILKAGKFVAANDVADTFIEGLYPCYGGNGVRGYVADFSHEGQFPLIGRQGALCGNVNFATGKFRATEHAVVVQPKDELVDVRWLYYKLIAMDLRQYATGAAQPGLAVATLEKLPISIPEIDLQRAVAQTFDRVEQLISLRKQQLAKMDELVKARFVEMFGDVKTNKYGWEKCDFDYVTTKITDGEHGTVSRVEKDEGYLYFMARNITKDGTIDLSETSYVPEHIHQKIYKRCNPEEEDILLVCVGATIGKSALVSKELGRFSMARSVALLKPDRKKVNSRFLLNLLRSDAIQSNIANCAHAAAQAGLYTNMIKTMDAFLPPIELQNQFADFVEQTEKSKLAIQQSLDKLETLKKALMQKYFG